MKYAPPPGSLPIFDPSMRTDRLGAGSIKYHGQWHTFDCMDENNGCACSSACQAERAALKALGVPINAADDESWRGHGARLAGWPPIGGEPAL